MKDNKTSRVELRLTPTEKDRLKQYAEKHGLTMSEAIRSICFRVFQQEDK